MTAEEEAMKAYAEAGVDLPELKTEEPEVPQEPIEPKVDEPTEPVEPLIEEPKVERKRSIYDDLKDKKSELKSERTLREQAEHERDELKSKLEASKNAVTPEEKQFASDDLESFAQEIGADPQAIRKMKELFFKDAQPQSDPALAEKLAKFEAWQAQNQEVMEKQMFEDEYQSSLPKLKEILPKASEEEMQGVRKEIERLSHTKEYHDKDLDYIAWKNKDTLSALISPKKAGLERKGRNEAQDEFSTEFNPNADYSKMSLKEREVWEESYRKMMDRAEGLSVDANGKKILV